MKHTPFQSIYRPNFEVVEQRQGRRRLYPHTDQLPLLLRALNLEFYGGLPDRLAHADHRADAFHKIALKTAGLMFTNAFNAGREDELRLYALPDPHLVTRLAIVQQCTEETRHGPVHHFKFYAGEHFCPEIRLSGRRLGFTDHILQRFSARVPNRIGTNLTLLLLAFYGSPIVVMPCGPGPAIIIQYLGSVLAFPFDETDDEIILTTCLTVNEIHQLTPALPAYALNFHYDLGFTPPAVRNWYPLKWMTTLYQAWERKVELPKPSAGLGRKKWSDVGHWVKGHTAKEGHGPGSRYVFLDHIPGPNTMPILPHEVEPQHHELEDYKRADPSLDWDSVFAARRTNQRIAE